MDPTEFGKQMDVDDLVAVHLSKYLPVNGIIRSLNSVFPEDTLRNTVHFSINHPVGNVGFYGNWDSTKYAVIAPLDKLCAEENNQIWNFNVVDTYFIGDVNLPSDSTIIVSSNAYEDLVEQGIVDKDTLMSKIFDERYPPKSDDHLVIEKDGIRYMILSWNAGNLREETYREIARQDYECMPGGQWNWGWSGAEKEDQERVANKMGAQRAGIHSNDDIHFMESLSHTLVGFRLGNNDRFVIDAYLNARRIGVSNDSSELINFDENAYLGFQRLQTGRSYTAHLPDLLRVIESQKETLPEDYHYRINRFLKGNKAKLRSFIPDDVIAEFALPL